MTDSWSACKQRFSGRWERCRWFSRESKARARRQVASTRLLDKRSTPSRLFGKLMCAVLPVQARLTTLCTDCSPVYAVAAAGSTSSLSAPDLIRLAPPTNVVRLVVGALGPCSRLTTGPRADTAFAPSPPRY